MRNLIFDPTLQAQIVKDDIEMNRSLFLLSCFWDSCRLSNNVTQKNNCIRWAWAIVRTRAFVNLFRMNECHQESKKASGKKNEVQQSPLEDSQANFENKQESTSYPPPPCSTPNSLDDIDQIIQSSEDQVYSHKDQRMHNMGAVLLPFLDLFNHSTIDQDMLIWDSVLRCVRKIASTDRLDQRQVSQSVTDQIVWCSGQEIYNSYGKLPSIVSSSSKTHFQR